MTDVSVSSRTTSESPLTERQWVRRGELLEAARRVFERDGYHGTTVSAVLQAAGLSQRAFYLYLADKQGVMAAQDANWQHLQRRDEPPMSAAELSRACASLFLDGVASISIPLPQEGGTHA